MKKLISLFCVFLISGFVFSQNLSLSQILSVRKMNLAEAEEYLTQKGWKFFEAKEKREGELVVATFAYNVGMYDNKAESFLGLFYYKFPEIENLLRIQVHKESKYLEYLNQIKSWGGRVLKSYVEDDSIVKVYQGSTMTYVIYTSTSEDDFYSKSTVYQFLIMTNESYENSGQ